MRKGKGLIDIGLLLSILGLLHSAPVQALEIATLNIRFVYTFHLSGRSPEPLQDMSILHDCTQADAVCDLFPLQPDPDFLQDGKSSWNAARSHRTDVGCTKVSFQQISRFLLLAFVFYARDLRPFGTDLIPPNSIPFPTLITVMCPCLHSTSGNSAKCPLCQNEQGSAIEVCARARAYDYRVSRTKTSRTDG